MKVDYSNLLEPILKILQGAGHAIMKVYLDPQENNDIQFKADHSPLTVADRRSNDLIMEQLASISEFPILSEESRQVDFDIRRKWNKFWLVDPLDGTKEFINRNGEFTVNVALIENGLPSFGAIGVPAKNIYYFGFGTEAIKIENGISRVIKVNNKSKSRIAVRSKSHASPEEEVILERYDVHDFISVGSSLKFCMVAEGKADIYYRHGPTMEWDTAAGHAIVRSAGGEVFSGGSAGAIFSYNKENLLNGSFLCIGFEP